MEVSMSVLSRELTQQQDINDVSTELDEAFRLLQETRDLENTLLGLGLDGIDRYVSNIEGEWLKDYEE